jgi:plasmid replication initiation protein
MATQQLTLPGSIVKKHNELVRSKINIANVDGSRILANLIACVRHDDTEFKGTYQVPVKEFLSDQGGKSYANIKAMCRELAKATAESEEPDPDGPHPIFRIYTFFSLISYRKGVVTARFNTEMQPLLLNLRRCFTEYNLTEYLTLPSLYSQRIFEILKSWANSPEVILSVADLHRLLDTPPSFRADYRNFRTRVIEKAYKDIHAKTSLRYEWEPIKVGHSVEAIRFSFGPGRRAIAAAEFAKAKEAKARRLESNRFLRASACATAKNGKCDTQDNRPIVCKICLHMDFCGEILRHDGKPFDPTLPAGKGPRP